MKLFTFDPEQYTDTYARKGYVHITEGLSEEFYQVLCKQVEEYLQGELLKNFALGNKQQALYQFPDEECHRELIEGVAAVCGLDPDKLIISERHIKSYESDAHPKPLAHKDRFASEVSVGFSVRVPQGSTLVFYPENELEINPFNSSAELRASLRADAVPEVTLQGAKRVEINDVPRDVMMFRGNAIWHLREQPAGTVMVYFKMNTFNCDPIGEDPASEDFRKRSRELATWSDAELEQMIPQLGRRVDYVQRRFNHEWQEVLGVVLWGDKHLTIDEQEYRMLQALDGQRTVGDIVAGMDGTSSWRERADKIRVLAVRGVIDLLPACEPVRVNGVHGKELALSRN